MSKRHVKYRIVLEFNSTLYDRATGDEPFSKLMRLQRLDALRAELIDGLDGSESMKAPEFMKIIEVVNCDDLLERHADGTPCHKRKGCDRTHYVPKHPPL